MAPVSARRNGSAGDASDSRLATVASGPLLLVTPFAAFVKYHDYSFFAPELVVWLVFLSVVGLALGLLMALTGNILRVPITAGLITLFIDVQFDWIANWARFALSCVAVLLVCWLQFF